ncbi:MAG: hypothetical protein M1831_007401 [Alyxoria varia]|nr:MAG: hypothetical protein M1831_007401 [Alyxoria varia]
MCLVVLSTALPDYPFILLSNRDEFLHRPTVRASFWPAPSAHVLGGRDLQHPTHGTWLGLTTQGRIAILTNFREEDAALISGNARSRGEIAKEYLESARDSREDPGEWARDLVGEDGTGLKGVGGFSLIFGRLGGASRDKMKLGVLSNRTEKVGDVVWLFGNNNGNHDDAKEDAAAANPSTVAQSCVAQSNSHHGDRGWPKVVLAERLLPQLIEQHVAASETEAQLIDRCFELLSTDTLPRFRPGEHDWQTYTRELRHSIFVPALNPDGRRAEGDEPVSSPGASADAESRAGERAEQGAYGTQKQTVILVDGAGHATFIERTLYDGEGRRVLDKRDADRRYDFPIEGWEA